MLSKKNPYNAEIGEISELQKITANEITKQLEKYFKKYESCFVRSQQMKYFEAFEKGLLNNLY